MKARYGCALGLLAGVCLIGSAQAQSIVVGPQAGSMAVVPGALVTVPIVADMTGSGGRSLGSVAAQLVWRPGVLAIQGVGAGALGAPVVNADSAAGTLRFALANPIGVTGQSVLLNAVFAVVGAPGATDTLRLTLQELTNAGTFLDLLSIGHAMNASVCVSTGLFGDLDQSGTIDGFDALVILTDAVGLPIAPRTTVNGDVDDDGHVSTRDALVVLSYAVGLPVGGFRVGRLNPGRCTIRTAASVQVTPQTVAVTSGDRVPLAAVVRDSAGVAIQGTDLLWTSADTTVAKTDAAGTVVAMGPGTTRVYAIVAPGLKDSVTVSVSATRHVWYVDQARAAQNAGVELGSSQYPFSGIAQAISRAAPFDTVRIAPATYGEGVRLTVPLTLVGDSTAAGATTIRNATGTGIVVDSVGSGLVRLDRLHIDDAQGGVIVRGAGTAVVVDLEGVTVARSRGVGISVRRVDRLLLGHVTVQGAVHQGIEVDSVPKVYAHAVLVDGISEQTGVPRAVRVAWADSVVADSLFVITAGVRLDSVVAASFDGFTGRDSRGPAIEAYVRSAFTLDRGDISGTAEVDIARGEGPYAAALMVGLGDPAGTARFANTTIHDNGRPALGTGGGDSVLVSRLSVSNSPWRQTPVPWTVAFEGQRRVAVEYSTFTDNNGTHVGFEHYEGLMFASVDSSVFQGTALRGQHLVAMDVRRSWFRDTPESAVQANNVRNVALGWLDIGNLAVQQDDGQYGGPFGVDVTSADSLDLRHVSIHDNPFGAVICRSCRAVRADTSEFLRNGQYTGYLPGGQIGTMVLEGPSSASVYGVRIDGGGSKGLWLRAAGRGGRLSVDSSAFVGDSMSLVYVDQPTDSGMGDSLSVTGSTFRGRNHGGFGVKVYEALAGLVVDSSAFDSTTAGVSVYNSGPARVYGNSFTGVEEGLQASYTSDVVFDSNTVTCTNPAASDAVHLYTVGGWVTRNVLAGCLRGLWSENYYSTQSLVVIGNTVTRDSTYESGLIEIRDSYDSLVVSGNIIQGGRGVGLLLNGDYSGISFARVDSNTVQGVLGPGIVLSGLVLNPVEMTYNVIADNDMNGLVATVPVAGSFNTVVRNKQGGALFNTASGATFRRGNFVGNTGYGIVNVYGFPPNNILADSSYWGRTTGPRCAGGCDTSSVTVGDSVGSYVTFSPFASALVPGAPPIPAPPAAPPFRAARPHVALPAHLVARPVTPPPTAPGARPAMPPRPAAPVTPGRVQP